MTVPWTCRPYQAGDEAGIIQMYREVFGIEMSSELWRWTYQASPEEPAVIMVVEADGELLGHYAIQPRPFVFRKRPCTVGFAVGTMLLPKFRNVPALVEMARQAYALCRQRGYPWIYAFPNDQAHRVRCALLGWKALPELVEWEGPLPSASDKNPTNVSRWDRMPANLQFGSFDSRDAGHAISGSRSTDWLRWRFFNKPGGEYVLHTVTDRECILAYAVTKRYRREGILYGHVIDFQAAPNADTGTDEVLQSVWRQLAEWGVERVSCWARGKARLARCLSDAGLTLNGRTSNFCFLDLEGIHSVELANPDAWQVEMADSDVY